MKSRAQEARASLRLAVVVPVFNDQSSVVRLLEDLDRTGAENNWDVCPVLVDDGSVPELDLGSVELRWGGIQEIEVVQLTHNLGHQRAIAVGLCEAVNSEYDGFVVMDADGEDRPGDLPALVAAGQRNGLQIIFAERSQRPASAGFLLLYTIYRQVFRMLTGLSIKFGNFSYLPPLAAKRLVNLPQLWNHFSASVMVSRIPYTALPVKRGTRYDGSSKMSVVSLISHGLSSISVFVDSVLIRITIASFVFGGFLVTLILAAVILRLSVNWVTPGWTTTFVGSMLIVLLQATALTAISTFVVLQGRSAVLVRPRKVYRDFIERSFRITREQPGGLPGVARTAEVP
jgi:polyisoprenyl-phosphate glycosyltransferase